MQITDSLSLSVHNTSEYAVNTQTGAVIITMDTGGAISTIAVTEPSRLLVPANSILTFALNGDTATIARL
jgi:hypothetical protein